MTLVLDDENSLQSSLGFDPYEQVLALAKKVLKDEGFYEDVWLSLSLVDEDEIKAINKEARGIDKVTDVLSFPMISYSNGTGREHADKMSMDVDPESGELIFGDIVLCVPKVLYQADEYGHSIKREFSFLIVHSLLHLCGYDHIDEDERMVMEDKQEKILEELGITRKE